MYRLWIYLIVTRYIKAKSTKHVNHCLAVLDNSLSNVHRMRVNWCKYPYGPVWSKIWPLRIWPLGGGGGGERGGGEAEGERTGGTGRGRGARVPAQFGEYNAMFTRPWPALGATSIKRCNQKPPLCLDSMGPARQKVRK